MPWAEATPDPRLRSVVGKEWFGFTTPTQWGFVRSVSAYQARKDLAVHYQEEPDAIVLYIRKVS